MARETSRLLEWVRELRRRHVIRAAVIYVVVGLGAIEAADLLFPRLGLPDWTVQLVLGLVVVGFPIALVLAYALELTPDGLALDPGSAQPATGSAKRDAGTPGSGTGSGSGSGSDGDANAPVVPAPELPVPPADRDALLVLPFDNISPDPENEYFSDGLTEEIIADLSRIRSLGVISRTSAMRLKGTDRDVLTLGRELGVRYVLEGSVRRSGDDLRITAQLIDASSDRHLWSETYEGTVEDVFEIQERVAGAIAGALRVKLSPVEQRRLARRRIRDPVAHESYLRARHEMWSFSAAGLEKARRHVRNALDIVGDDPLLLATLGHIHVWFLQAGVSADPEHLERADDCADAVFGLDSESAHGHRLRGFIEFQRGDLRGARPHFRRSLEANPDDPDALLQLGYLYCLAGRTDDAIDLFDRLLAIDPLTPLNHAMPGFAATMEGRFHDALEPYGTFLRMDDDGAFAMMAWIWVLGLNGRIDEADPVVRRLAEAHGDTPFASGGASLYHGFRGEPDRAVAAVSPALREAARHTEMFSRFLADCYALAGEVEEALDWLERNVEIGMANYPWLDHIDPLLENVRGEPRFRRILERVEAEWRTFRDDAVAVPDA